MCGALRRVAMTLRALLLAFAVGALVAVALAPGAAADVRTVRYYGGNPFLVATAQIIPGANAWFGGAEFAPNGQTPRWVNVSDDLGVPVFAIACQDLQFDEGCGDDDDPSVAGCGARLDLATSRVPFSRDHSVGVLIFQTDTGVRGPPGEPSCGGLATQGTIRLTTS